MHSAVLLSIFLLIFQNTYALKCYTCTVSSEDSDTTCITDPANAPGNPIYDCDKKYCTIIRQELLDPRGKVVSFGRGCDDTWINDITEDSTYRIYHYTCKSPLCNGGSGKGDNDNSSKGYLGDKSTIICRGIRDGAITHSVSVMLLFFVITLVAVLI